MTDLANQCRPKTLNDIKGSAAKTGGIVDLLNLVIARNLHRNLNKFLITGSSGTGKSTISDRFARATLCINRQVGTSQPCGECIVCTGEEVANIYKHTITSPASSRDILRAFIEQSYRSPDLVGNEPSKHRQFIILEETQQASPELMAELLEPLEQCPDSTTWILGTMNFSKLSARDSVLAEALQSRCKELKLSEFTPEEIATTLVANLPELNLGVAKAIAKFSQGNMRRAYNLLAHFSLTHSLAEIKSEQVYNHLAGGANPSQRYIFWQELINGNGKSIVDMLNRWLVNGAEPKDIASLLESDLHRLIITHPHNYKLLAVLSSLSRWSVNSHYQLASVFLPHLGIDIDLKPQGKSAQATQNIWNLTNYQQLFQYYGR